MAADTLDIITLDDIYAGLNIEAGDAVQTAELEQVATAASRMIDQVFGPVVVRTVTAERHDGGRLRIWPRQTPVLSVTSVTEYASTSPTVLTAETIDTKPSYGYLLLADGHDCSILRRSSGGDSYWTPGRANITITYEAGRYATTSVVDRSFKEVAVVAAIHLWQHRGSGSGALTGDGPAFGGVPFSTDVLLKKLRALLPDEARPPWIA